MKRFILDRKLWLIPLAVWSAVVGVSLAWNWKELDRHAYELAVNRGRFVFKMVDSVRLWNARHGGVYAPITEETQPNPHLEIDDRDVVTLSGRKLTLLNPAYMTRQVAAVVAELSGLRMHLTSLKPLNPNNEAEPWEKEALTTFEQGGREWTSFDRENGQALFRYMAPLITKKACLKCHEKQGYEVGDVRGGLGVSFAVAPLLASTDAQRGQLAFTHVAVWLLLSSLTLLSLSRIREQMLSLKRAKDHQDLLVAQRTRELREEVAEREQMEERLRLLLESSGEGIYGVDAEGRCTFCNPTALRLLGLDQPSQILGHNVHDLVATGECRREDEGDALTAAYREGEPSHCDDAHFRRADGEVIPVEFRAHPMRRDGTVIGAVVTFADISERKAAEQQLRKLSEAVEHSPESVVITDVDGRIEYVNPQFLRTTGYSADEVVGENPRILQSGQTAPETYTRMWDTLTRGEVWNGEFLNRRKNGELFWEEASIAPIRDGQGQITHYVAVKEDITERKQAEAQIWRQANYDELTGLVNRSLFRDRLEHTIARARREHHRFAVLFLDLDGFKGVNDTLGHDVGDELLRQVGERLNGAMRRSDTIARLGGDEFTVIVNDTREPQAAVRTCEKILEVLAESFCIGGQEIRTSASIGIAIYPFDGEEVESLMKNADLAMYGVKRRGRSGYLLFQDLDEPGGSEGQER